MKDWQKQAFTALVNYSGCAIICVSPEGTILEFNPVAESLFGCRYAEVINENLFSLYSEEAPLLSLEALRDIVKTAIPQERTCPIKSKTGQVRLVRWNIAPIKSDSENYVLLFGVDITQDERRKESNAKLNAYLYNVVNNIPHAIVWKDCNSVFLGCNKIFAASAHLNSPEEIVGKTDHDMPWSKYAETYAEDDRRIIKAGVPRLNFEEPHMDSEGREQVVLVSKVPMRDEKHAIVGLLCIYTDITERKKQEESLKLAKEAADIANQLKSEFISNMAHDIRTPFSGIYSMVDILSRSETDDNRKECLVAVRDSAQELLNYANTILEFARLESGLIPNVEKKTSLRRLIEGIVVMEVPPARAKGLEISSIYDPSVPDFVIADAIRLQRIVTNLVSNAIKFTKQGSVKIIVKLVEKSEDKKSCILRIIIEDTGVGIPEDKRNFIYEKFVKAEASSRVAYKGLGLGLPMVKQLMEELGGELDVSSELGRGTTVVCTLPFALPLSNAILFDGV